MASDELPADPELVSMLWTGVFALSAMVVVLTVTLLWAERCAGKAQDRFISEVENNERICKVLIREGVLPKDTCYIRSDSNEQH